MRLGDTAMIARIRAEVEKECVSCEFQEGKYCNWWRKKTSGPPPCQIRQTGNNVLGGTERCQTDTK